MIFWLVFKVEISYRVNDILEGILVSFRGVFQRLYHCIVKYLNFHNSSFASRYFVTEMARPHCDTPLVLLLCNEDFLVCFNIYIYTQHTHTI